MLRVTPRVSVHSMGRFIRAVDVTRVAVPAASRSRLPMCPAVCSSSARVVSSCRFYCLAPTAPRLQSAKPAEGEEAAKEKQEGAEKKTEEQAAEEKAKAEEEAKKSTFTKLKEDLVAFPDIYNSPNMMNMAIFTIFCLCSTGTEREAEWWVDFWGVDGNSFKPWSWLGHALLTNNFLAMTFAMILFHSLSHAVAAGLGAQRFAMMMVATATFSGFMMWLTQATIGPATGLAIEKQFGPWDVIAAMMVHQYLSNGTTPWGLLLSFNGWVRYANIVGAICIVWYDPQPLLWGTLVGLALTKGKVFPIAAAAV